MEKLTCFFNIIIVGREGRYSPIEWKKIGMLFIRIQAMKIK